MTITHLTPVTSILITGGFGDLIAIESFMPVDLRNQLENIYYASPRNEELARLMMTLPNYPNLQNHYVFDGINRGLFHKEDVEEYVTEKRIPLPAQWSSVEDWSIMPIFERIHNGEFPFVGSSFLDHKLTHVPPENLPSDFIVICPATETDTSMPRRSFYPDEWQAVINYLELLNMPAVVINQGKHPVPKHRLIADHSNSTTIPEAIEILKLAKGYIGVDSFLSVLAAKLFQPPLLYIKSNNEHLDAHRDIYYGPKTRFPFLFKKFFVG